MIRLSSWSWGRLASILVALSLLTLFVGRAGAMHAASSLVPCTVPAGTGTVYCDDATFAPVPSTATWNTGNIAATLDYVSDPGQSDDGQILLSVPPNSTMDSITITPDSGYAVYSLDLSTNPATAAFLTSGPYAASLGANSAGKALPPLAIQLFKQPPPNTVTPTPKSSYTATPLGTPTGTSPATQTTGTPSPMPTSTATSHLPQPTLTPIPAVSPTATPPPTATPVTQVKLTASRTVVAWNGKVRFTVRVTPARPNAAVTLRQKVSTTWHTIQTGQLNGGGTTTGWTISVQNTASYDAIVAGTTSPAIVVRVQSVVTLRVVSGSSVTGRALPAATGHRVLLQQQGARNTWSTIGTAAEKSNGTFTFRGSSKLTKIVHWRAYDPSHGNVLGGYSNVVTVTPSKG